MSKNFSAWYKHRRLPALKQKYSLARRCCQSHLSQLFCKAPTINYLYKKLIITAQVDNLRNGIIEKLLTISNKDYLKALYELVDNSKLDKNKIDLTEEQVLMLKLSDKDIKHGRLITQHQLDKEDLQWLKGQ